VFIVIYHVEAGTAVGRSVFYLICVLTLISQIFFFRFPSSYSKPLLPVSQISRACRPSVVLIIPCLAGLLSLLLLVLHVVPLLGWYPTYFSPLRSVPSTFLPRGVYSCTPWYPIAHSSSSTSAILVRLFYI
jgi:hypothetical protein